MERIIHYNPHRKWIDSSLKIKYNNLNLDFDFPFIDRSETIPHYLKIKPLSKPQSFDSNFNLSFSDICSVQSLIILGLNKKVNVLWSGGLDSTTALVSLLANAKNKDQIRILANYNSIIESGYIYDTFFKRFDAIIDTNGGRNNFNEDEIYVTGALGNQLFSLGSFNSNYDFANLNKPFIDYVNKKEYEFIFPALTKSPRTIETLEDYIWFKTFMFKWDHQRLAMINKWVQPNNVRKYLDIFHGFYYHKEFEQWSIHRKEKQHNKELTKLPMRNYILKELGKEAEDYCNRKKITHSIFTPYKNNYKFTTEDFKVHYDTSL
jgi:hypothetical protein